MPVLPQEPSPQAVRAANQALVQQAATLTKGAPQVLDAGQVQHLHETHVMASTFANLELRSAKEKLREYVALYDAARQENQQLAEAARQRDAEAVQVVEFLRQELEARSVALKAREEELAGVRADLAARHAAELEQQRQLTIARDGVIAELRGDVAALQSQVAGFADFARERQELRQEARERDEAHRLAVVEYEKELTRMKFQGLEEKVKLKAVEKAMTERFTKEAHDEAMRLVDAKSRAIRDENADLRRRTSDLEEELQAASEVARRRHEKLTVLSREVVLAAEGREEFARQGCHLTRAARDSSRRVQELEAKCSDMAAAAKAATAAAAAEHQGALDRAHAERDDALRSVAQHRRELLRTRQLGRCVVEQRGRLERFFHAVLDDIAEGKRADAEVAGGARGTPAQLGALMDDRYQRGYKGDLDGRVAPAPVSARGPPSRSLVPSRPAPLGTPRARVPSSQRQGRLPQLPAVGTPRTPRTPRTRGRPTLDAGPAPPKPELEGPASSLGDAAGAGTDFGGMPWADKERVVRALLFELNRAMYKTPRTASVGETFKNAEAVEVESELGDLGHGHPSPSDPADSPDWDAQPFVPRPPSGAAAGDPAL